MQDEKEEKKLSPVVLVQEVKVPDIQVLFYIIQYHTHAFHPFFCYELPFHSFKIFFTEFKERNLLESCVHFV